MAFTHLSFDESTKYGQMLRSFLRQAEQSDDAFTDVRDVIIQMRDGDGSQNVHYAEVVKKFKFGGYDPTQGDPSDAQNAIAKSAFEEMDSAYSKTSGNGSVSNVRAARDPMFAKLR